MNLLEILKKNADNAKSYIDGLVSKKQDTLTFDTAPTKGSQNPVTSDGIQKAIAAKTIDLSNYPTKNGTGATGTWPISISGAATKASQDSNGRVIADTYLKKAGDTAAGNITAPNFIGHLKGNADTATACSGNSATATKLHTARTINFNGALDGNVTFDGSNNVSVVLAEFNHTEAIVDLTDATKYDTDTYYPVVGKPYAGRDLEHKYRCWTPIHAVKTAPWGHWANGNGDYSAELKITDIMNGWGARKNYITIDLNSCNGADVMPITYSQMPNASRSVFFVRGGGKYWFSSTCNSAWELKTDTFTENGNTVAPTKTYFTPESKNPIKTVGINISGNADSATKATNDGNGANIASTYVKKTGGTTTGKITFESTDLNALPEVKKTSDDMMSGIRFSSKTQFLGAVGKRLSNGEDLLNLRSNNNTTDVVLDSRNYNSYAPTKTGTGASGTWGISITGNASTATKLATPRTLALTGKVAGSATFDGSANTSINVTSVNADTASKLSTARKINITGNATGSASFNGSGDISISTTVNESKHAAAADILKSSAATETSTVARPVWLSWEGDNTKQTVSPNLTYTCSTKTLTAANFKGHLSGNADTATTATTATKANGLTGSLNFPDIGDVATSNKISWNGSTNGADIYYQTTASDQGNLVLNLRDDANCYLRIAYNGAFKSYFTPADGNFHGNVNGKSDSAGSADTSAAINYSNIGTNYIKAGSADTGNAANQTANMVIGSWYGITFYDVCSNKIAGGMNVRDGSLTMKGTITGSKVYNAVYNDYAEFFEKDEDTAFEAGDIVALDTNSEEERYIKATEDSIVVVGVCTHEYAHIIGGKGQTIEENEKEFVPISLMGRVHVKVDDTVKRGDKVTASKVPGIGRKAMPGEHSIGTALTNPSNGKVRVLINL